MLDPVTRNHVEKAAETLQDELAGTSRQTIARFLPESVDLLGESKINVFVPVLARLYDGAAECTTALVKRLCSAPFAPGP